VQYCPPQSALKPAPKLRPMRTSLLSKCYYLFVCLYVPNPDEGSDSNNIILLPNITTLMLVGGVPALVLVLVLVVVVVTKSLIKRHVRRAGNPKTA